MSFNIIGYFADSIDVMEALPLISKENKIYSPKIENYRYVSFGITNWPDFPDLPDSYKNCFNKLREPLKIQENDDEIKIISYGKGNYIIIKNQKEFENLFEQKNDILMKNPLTSLKLAYYYQYSQGIFHFFLESYKKILKIDKNIAIDFFNKCFHNEILVEKFINQVINIVDLETYNINKEIANYIIESGGKLKEKVRSFIIANQQLDSYYQVLKEIEIELNDNQTNIDKLAKLFSSDSALSRKIIQINNSPYYYRGQRIDDIKTAITRIGFSELSRFIYLYKMQNLLKGNKSKFHRTIFFQSIILACISDFMCEKLKFEKLDRELLFEICISVNIGITIIYDYFNNEYNEYINLLETKNTLKQDLEVKVFGSTINIITLFQLLHWNFPDHYYKPIILLDMDLTKTTNIKINHLGIDLTRAKILYLSNLISKLKYSNTYSYSHLQIIDQNQKENANIICHEYFNCDIESFYQEYDSNIQKRIKYYKDNFDI